MLFLALVGMEGEALAVDTESDAQRNLLSVLGMELPEGFKLPGSIKLPEGFELPGGAEERARAAKARDAAMQCAPGESGWTLDCLVSEAASSNPSVISKRLETVAADAAVDAARWQFFPTPSISAQQYKGDRMAVISLRQPVWTGGRLTSDLGVAQERLAVAEKGVEEARFDMAQRVVSAWGAAYSAAGRRKALELGFLRLEVMHAMIARRIETKLGAKVDLELVKARLDQARSDLAQATAVEKSALATLSQLVGKDVVTKNLAPIQSEGWGQSKTLDVDTMVSRTLETSPRLRRIEAEIKVAEQALNRAKADYWPTAFARMEYQIGSVQGGLPEGGRIYVGFEHSLDAGLTIASKVSGATASRDAAMEQLTAAKRDVTAAVVADVEGYRAAIENEKGMEGNLASMKGVAASYQRMFVAGKRSWLDLLNTIREQTDGERQLSEVRVQRAVMAYRLKLDSGEWAWLQQR